MNTEGKRASVTAYEESRRYDVIVDWDPGWRCSTRRTGVRITNTSMAVVAQIIKDEHMDFIQGYVDEQVALGHMTGPYAREEVERILGSPFRTSPLAVTEKPGSPGKWRLIQNCSFQDAEGVSVNSMIDSDEFPTIWGKNSENL